MMAEICFQRLEIYALTCMLTVVLRVLRSRPLIFQTEDRLKKS